MSNANGECGWGGLLHSLTQTGLICDCLCATSNCMLRRLESTMQSPNMCAYRCIAFLLSLSLSLSLSLWLTNEVALPRVASLHVPGFLVYIWNWQNSETNVPSPCIKHPAFWFRAAMSEWLRSWTWNPMGIARVGSNPARCESFLRLKNCSFLSKC